MPDAALQLHQNRFRPDRLLLLALLALMTLGALFIYSARAVHESSALIAWHRQLHFRQIIWYGIGLASAALICLKDYRTIARWSLVLYWANILLLAAVLIPGIGAMRYGARRWIDLGFFQLQPSELAKLSVILVMAQFLSRPQDELRQPRTLLKALGLMALPFFMVLKEPDLGSALMIVPPGLAMLYVAGVPVRFLKRLVGGGAFFALIFGLNILFAPPSWQVLKLEDYQKRRLLVYFGMSYVPAHATPVERARALADQRRDSYNVEQAVISVGSGGLTGKGWRQGTQNALGYLPRGVAHNDFIFSVIAEESGFVGSLVVLTLYATILFVGIRIASHTRDRLGKLLAVGVVTLLFSHVFVNIGMNIRLVPVTGVPLPLLSYGGSSVICSLIAAGILQNIHLHQKTF
jgi:rod shape determining protein RodA